MQTYLIVLCSILFLNLLPFSDRFRIKVSLPISMIILWVFLAFRYNYGIDYISYNTLFYDPELYSRSLNSEPLFWWVMKLFNHYYQFIIFQSTVICYTFYYFTKKYISPKYYWLFFILFMCNTSMMFTITTAMRSGFAAMVFIWGTEFFYLRKSKPILYLGSIFLAYLFHNSAIMLIIFPFAEIISKKMSLKAWITLVIIGFIVSLTSISSYIESLFNLLPSSSITSSYSEYLDNNKFGNTSLTIAITHLFWALPCIFIFKYTTNKNEHPIYKRIASITLLYVLMYIFGFDFQCRLSVLLFPFYIISILHLLSTTNSTLIKSGTIALITFSAIWTTYIMFISQLIEQPEGSFWFYQTIFDAPSLP